MDLGAITNNANVAGNTYAATLTARWVVERSNMGINGVGSFYAQNYDVQNRGHSTREKSSVDDFACMFQNGLREKLGDTICGMLTNKLFDDYYMSCYSAESAE